MRKMLNTLFVLTPESYLSLEGEPVVVIRKEKKRHGFHCTHWKEYSPLPMQEHLPR